MYSFSTNGLWMKNKDILRLIHLVKFLGIPFLKFYEYYYTFKNIHTFKKYYYTFKNINKKYIGNTIYRFKTHPYNLYFLSNSERNETNIHTNKRNTHTHIHSQT